MATRWPLLEWAVPLALYAVLTAALFARHVEGLNPDGVVYIQLARLWLAGDYAHAISGYWSPLLSWSIAALLASGVDGLTAAWAVLAAWGALLVCVFVAFLRTLDLAPGTRVAAAAIVAVGAERWALTVITPDVMLAAALLLYLTVVSRTAQRPGLSGAFVSGVIAGLAYLTKAYAFPFFLAHFPLTVAYFFPASRRQRWAMLTAGFAGFALVALPWVVTLSVKYGHPTFSTTARIAHAIVGPGDMDRYHPMQFAKPSPPHLTVWEAPENLSYRYWSPFDNASYFRHQLLLAWSNMGRIRDDLARYDFLALALVAVPFALWLRFWNGPTPALRPLLWIAGTMAIYASGFAAVYYEARYVEPLILPLALSLCAGLAPVLTARTMATVILIVSFALLEVPRAYTSLSPVDSPRYREIGTMLREQRLSGPLASSDWALGLYVAYHAGIPYLGFPAGANARDNQAALRGAGARTLLIWEAPREWYLYEDPGLALAVAIQSGWRLVESKSIGEQEVLHIYAAE